MADDRITIFFEPKGDKRLIKAINSLARAQGRLGASSKKVAGGTMRISKNNAKANKSFNALGGTMSVVRSRLLVYTFAVGLLNKTIGKTISLAMKQEDAEKKLSVQLGYTSKSLLDFATAQQKVTASGDEEIIAVMGTMSAFTKNEEQIKSLTQATLDLAAGQDMQLNDAAMLVAKTFGSSTDSLNRYGIKTKGVAGSQARLESLTGAVAVKYDGLSRNLDTTSKALTQMGNAFGDAGEEIGEAFLPITKKLAVGMTNFVHETLIPFISTVKRIDVKETVKNFMGNFQALQNFMVGNITIMIRLFKLLGEKVTEKLMDILPSILEWLSTMVINVGEQIKLGLELIGAKILQGFARITSPGGIKKMWINFQNWFIDKLNEMGERIAPVLKFFGFEFEKLAKIPNEKFAETKYDKLVEEKLAAFKDTEIWKTIADNWVGEGDTLDQILADMGENFGETIKGLFVLTPGGEDGGGGGGGGTNVLGITDDEIAAMIERWGEYQNAVMGVANAYDKLKMQGIENDRQTELAVANSIKWERKRQQEVDKINKKYDAEAKKQKEKMRDIKIAEAISNTALGMTKAHTDPGGVAGWILAGLIGLQGLMNIATIKAQKYQYGGLVGGGSHSQGGTMIEAERGEFVMSRRAVDAIGSETMNRINQGGGGGSVNISFNGNVLSKDFIEDEAIPQIKEAIRRGADIGVG